MELEKRIKALSVFRDWLMSNPKELEDVKLKAAQQNTWFKIEFQTFALKELGKRLSNNNLLQWTSNYTWKTVDSKVIALVLPGNIPLVGFHDIISILLVGHIAQIKLSSQDTVLTPYLLKKLTALAPELEPQIRVVHKQERFDAVIATGSDNSARYFEYYFKKYPHIIRKNRTSVALLKGTESKQELLGLAGDVAMYFGLGCRNVTKIYLPDRFEITKLIDAFEPYNAHINHHKYFNNYEYQKTILLLNKIPHYDNGFLLFTENEGLFPPLATVYFEYYTNYDELLNRMELLSEKIQCMVGADLVPFGYAQEPGLMDYADGIDTIDFLLQL